MIWLPFCPLCGQVAVMRTGDPCVRCVGEMAALIDPIVRPPNPQHLPFGVRVLNWLGRHAPG